ncbi:MAG: NADH-ubiquinone oxidoreductase-F iron-sulfur binding region domain-containing protein [Brevinematia bacterium]
MDPVLREAIAKVEDRRSRFEKRVLVCGGASCDHLLKGSKKVIDVIREFLKRYNLENKVDVSQVGCLGLCGRGPLVKIEPDGVVYERVFVDDVERIMKKHLVDKEIDERNLLDTNIPFYQRQVRIVLDHCGEIDPESIEEYIAVGGYGALYKAVTEMTPEEVISEVKKSGLKGRGGAGFSTGVKWENVSKQEGEIKYIICNAEEGDPGAFVDRGILESLPHRVLEGMAIAGYAVGASHGFICINSRYTLAIDRIIKAINSAERLGVLGTRIFGTNFNFRIDVRIAVGAYITGEETGLISLLEGRRGNPRQKPPFPTEKGIYGRPTVVNNVETFANIYAIIENGGEWFRGFGTKNSPGTKLFSITGKVNNIGLVEVPLGTPLREIIFDIGGGIPNGRKFKALQIGGPLGSFVPEALIDTPADFESMRRVGANLGSGEFIVLDDSSCIVDVTKFFIEFCADESCGQCVPCRVGDTVIKDILVKITKGSATQRDFDNLLQLVDVIRECSLCGLGQGSVNPLISALKYFREEFEEHFEKRICRAGVCELSHFEEALAH